MDTVLLDEDLHVESRQTLARVLDVRDARTNASRWARRVATVLQEPALWRTTGATVCRAFFLAVVYVLVSLMLFGSMRGGFGDEQMRCLDAVLFTGVLFLWSLCILAAFIVSNNLSYATFIQWLHAAVLAVTVGVALVVHIPAWRMAYTLNEDTVGCRTDTELIPGDDPRCQPLKFRLWRSMMLGAIVVSMLLYALTRLALAPSLHDRLRQILHPSVPSRHTRSRNFFARFRRLANNE